MRYLFPLLYLVFTCTGCATTIGVPRKPISRHSAAGMPQAVAKLLGRGKPAPPAVATDDVLRQAHELYHAGNLPASRAVLQQARRTDPNWTAGYALEASIAVDLGERDEAERMLEAAALANPQSAPLQYSTGILLVHYGNARSGLRALERAVQLDPLSTHYAHELAGAYAGFGNLDAAESVLEAALEQHAQDRTLLLSLARVAEAGARWRKAEICYELALRDAENPLFRRQRARCLYRLGDFELAVAEFAACGEEFVQRGPLVARLEYEDARRRARATPATPQPATPVVAAVTLAITPAQQETVPVNASAPYAAAASRPEHSHVTQRLRQPTSTAITDSPYRQALAIVDPS